jgi:enoyl-CoA hydratase/carnithine racemase
MARRSMLEHIIVEDEEGARTIVMSRPKAKNALTSDMYLAMGEAIDSAQSDDAIRCLILAGRSGVFTSGSEADESTQAEMHFLQSLGSNQKPIVAAVDGLANGIGTLLVFHCDFVIADTTATFSSPLVRRDGLVSAAHKLFVPRSISHQRAFAMMVMGQSMSANEACEAGFVNLVVAPGHALAEARHVARQIAALPAEAVAISRKLLRQSDE